MDKKFLASYLFDDGTPEPPEWVIEFYAKDMEDAQKRVLAIKETLKLDGEFMEKIDVSDEQI